MNKATKKKIHTLYSRGSEWRQWDLHIHTPASFEWKGGKLFRQMTEAERTKSVDEMITAMNESEPAVYALMDYWTFEGWFALRDRLIESGAPKLLKTVFPGIELRLVSPTKYRLNAHVIFSDDVSHQDLKNFQSKLEVALVKDPLSDECLIRLVREKVGKDLLTTHGYKPEDLDDTHTAIIAGSKIAEIVTDSYREAITKFPEGKAIGFIPWDPHDGLAKADWKTHYSYVLDLMTSSPIFETRRQELWGAFTGTKTDKNKEWFDAFQFALGNKPCLAVSGSDAHSFAAYGKFPSGKVTWIKADPTFLGLVQTIKEPAKRSFIGDRPEKMIEVAENKTYFIDSINVIKKPESSISDHWLSTCNLPLSPDLIAIIGNKGSGKSALADIIALLGCSRQTGHFSFLSQSRFRQKPKELAKHFTGTIQWRDLSSTSYCLSENPPSEAVELVRYIPQLHFETLCNEHVTGRSNAFEQELRAVIFSHTSPSIRQKALDFDQLIEQQESSFRDQLGESRKDLKKLNVEISSIESQLQPEIRKKLEELLALKTKQIAEHLNMEPAPVAKPSEQLTEEQQKASDELDKIAQALKALDEDSQIAAEKDAALASKITALITVRERLRLFQKQYKQFQDETKADLAMLGVDPTKLASVKLDEKPLEELAALLPLEQDKLVEEAAKVKTRRLMLQTEQLAFQSKLNEPQLLYQQNVQAREAWQERLRELKGAHDAPETLEGLQTRIEQLQGLPAQLEEKKAKRLNLCGEIFDILDAQRNARAKLFGPVQDLIHSNSLIRDDYKLQFLARLASSPDLISSSLFGLIKQNSGEFRGEEESHAAIRKIAEQYDLNKKQETLQFVTELMNKIYAAAYVGGKETIGITSILRVNKTPSDVYDLLFGLPFLEPRYSLLFQETQIEQLSPGQRGALLLIFYLLVDKGHNPIILDQPEENLDNETVVSLLVPVLSEAKKRRQIIMVTHNPNLAVVCDAEQIVYSSFDRKNGCRISYVSGAIENPTINQHVVNVLEGTKPAFNNRRIKYH